MALLLVVVFKGLTGLPQLWDYWEWRTSPEWLPRYNLQPFFTIKNYMNDYSVPAHMRNIWGNILPFVPMGLIMPLAFTTMRNFVKTSGMCMLLVTAMECMQLITGLGSFDVDDIILNTLSCMAGYATYKLFSLPVRRAAKRK